MSIKVLVIDNDAAVTATYKDGLPAQEFEVFVANSSLEGINMAHQIQPDVVVLDLMMPQMSGWEVCRTIRTFSQVPVLIISAVVTSEGVMQALEEGANDYIVKPVPLGVLASRLKRLVRQARINRDSSDY
jgi:two-component system KDP operon response regulator KdpE